jgi:hypothetical protein
MFSEFEDAVTDAISYHLSSSYFDNFVGENDLKEE